MQTANYLKQRPLVVGKKLFLPQVLPQKQYQIVEHVESGEPKLSESCEGDAAAVLWENSQNDSGVDENDDDACMA